MKKVKKFIFIFLVLFISMGKVNALSASLDNITLSTGEDKTIDLFANVNEEVTSVTFTLVFSTYDIPAYFTVNAAYTDTTPNEVKHTINFPEPTTGKIKLGSIYIKPKTNPNDRSGTVNIHSGTATNSNGNSINLKNLNINIKINNEITPPTPESQDEPVDKQTYNLLKSIDSKIVKLNLKEDVFEYEINISKDTEELDLKPVPKEDNYQVDISNQKISELTDSLITIKVTDNDSHTQEYKIKVNVLKDTTNVQVDKSNFKEKNIYKGKWIVVIAVLSIVLVLGIIFNKKK